MDTKSSFFSGGRAYELLKKQFNHVYPVTPVAWYENASGIITTASLINILFPLPIFNGEARKLEVKTSSAMETIHRYYDLRAHLHEVKPDLVIADGDIHALRLAQRWKIPNVYITNVVRPSYGFSKFLSPGESVTETYVKSLHKNNHSRQQTTFYHLRVQHRQTSEVSESQRKQSSSAVSSTQHLRK